MGLYNVLRTSLTCPRCGHFVETTVDCYFGDCTQMTELQLGDRYPWLPRMQPEIGGRPESGSVDGEGYMECPDCHKDAFLRVIVREDVVVRVEPDATQAGHIPD